MTTEQSINRAKIEYLRNNTAAWIENCCKIYNKDLKLVKFIPNNQQRELLEVMDRDRFPIVCKQRQNGISSIVAAKALHICLTIPNSSCLLMSYRASSVRDLWKKLKDIYNSIPKFVSVPLIGKNKEELIFANGSRIVCCTCGNRDAAHGATLSYVHISEAALCRDSLPSHIASIQAALVPNGIICIESTPQGGSATQFAEMFQEAQAGDNLFTPVFFSWTKDIGRDGMHYKEQQDYAKRYKNKFGHLPMLEELDEEELELYYMGCDFSILAWRRIKLKEPGGAEKFRANYPVDADTAFLTSLSDSMFDTRKIQEKINEIRDIKSIPMPDDLPDELKSWYNSGLSMWAKPEPNTRYFIGCDTSEGLGRNSDFSVIEVMDEYGFQCAELRTNKTKPFRFAKLIDVIGKYYNEGLLIIEKTGPGIATLSKLVEDFEYYNIFRSKAPDARGFVRRKDGFSTSEQSKKKLVQDFIEWFESDEDKITINSKQLLTEMLAFSLKNGRMEAATGHDDTVMAMGMAIQGYKSDIYYI